MKIVPSLLGFALIVGLTASPAWAASNTTIGVGSGAVAGALVGGPIGAVAGAIVGGVVGASSDRAAPRRYRRARVQRRSAVPAARPVAQRAPVAAPRPVAQRMPVAEPRRALTPIVPASTGSVGGSPWRDPR